MAVVSITATAALGCRRSKLPMIDHVWLGPSHGCVTHLPTSPSKTGLQCWGNNESGQIGDGTTTARQAAAPLTLLGSSGDSPAEPKQLALGQRHSCGVFENGAVKCWGANEHGQLGRGSPTSSAAPLDVAGFDVQKEPPVTRVAVGKEHTCIHSTRSPYELTCFGANDKGQTGLSPDGTFVWNRGPVIKFFALGDAHTCVAYAPAPTTVEEVLCKGRGAIANASLLVGVPIKALAAGGDHTCVLLHDGTVRCWGKNDQGQLGDGTTNDATEPTTVLDVKGADQIALGARHSCAHLWNGTVACWGDNRHHQLANGTMMSTGRAGVIVGLVQVKELVAAGDGSCARLEDRSVRCWGRNDHYELGTGSTVEQSVPMSIRYQ